MDRQSKLINDFYEDNKELKRKLAKYRKRCKYLVLTIKKLKGDKDGKSKKIHR